MNNLIEILEKEGIEPAVKSLGSHNPDFFVLFLVDVANSVLNIFEREVFFDNNPRLAIDGTSECFSLNFDACALSRYATDSANKAEEYSVYARDAARSAVGCVQLDPWLCVKNAVSACDSYDSKMATVREIQALFIKHFGGKR